MILEESDDSQRGNPTPLIIQKLNPCKPLDKSSFHIMAHVPPILRYHPPVTFHHVPSNTPILESIVIGIPNLAPPPPQSPNKVLGALGYMSYNLNS